MNKYQLNYNLSYLLNSHLFDIEFWAFVDANNKTDQIEVKYKLDGEIMHYSNYFFPKKVSVKGTKIKNLFRWMKANNDCKDKEMFYREFDLRRHVHEAYAHYLYTQLSTLDVSAYPRLRFAESFYTSRHPGFYLVAPNCKYQPGKLNNVNLIACSENTYRLEVTDGYQSKCVFNEGPSEMSLDDAYELALNLIEIGYSQFKVA